MILPLHQQIGPLGRRLGGGASTLLDGIRAYWKLEETGSADRVDQVAAIVLPAVGDPPSVAGVVGNACSFDGSTQWLLISSGAPAAVEFAASFSIAAWVYRNAAAPMLVVSRGPAAGATTPYTLQYNNGVASFDFRLGNGTSVFQVLLPSTHFQQWVHLVARYDHSASRLYLRLNNDSAGETNASAIGPATTAAVFAIGTRANSPAQPWNGRIDEVGLWDRVLTETEMAALYNSGNGLAYPFS